MKDFNWTIFLQRKKYTQDDLGEACKLAQEYTPWLNKTDRTDELNKLYTDFYRTMVLIKNIDFVSGDFSIQQKKAINILTQIEQAEMLELFKN